MKLLFRHSNYDKKNCYFFFLAYYKNKRKDKNKKSNFYESKKLFKIDDIVDKVLASEKGPYGTNKSVKYFIGYSNDDDIKPLCIKLLQMIGYTKHFESNKAMSFKVVDNKLLKKWITINSLVGKKFDSEPVFGDNDKCIKTKMKIYNGNVNANFQCKKEPNKCASCRFLSLRMLDFVVESKKKYYPETLLEECKCETKTTERENLINGNLEATSSVYETDSDFDNETNN